MKLYSKVLAALLSASLAAQLVAPAYAYNVSSNTTSTGSTGGQIVVNNQDGTQQVLTQEDLENGTNLPEGIVIENGTNTPAPTTPSPEVSQAPAQESEAPQESEEPAQESEAPVQESPAPTQEGGETGSDRIDMNLPVVSPSTENGTSGTTTQQSSELAVYWNPGSGYGVDESKMSVVFPQQQSQKGIIQQGLSWLSNLVSGVFGGGSKTVQVPAGKDSNSGRSPMAPVKTFEAAMEQAQALADEQGVDVRDVTIYSMNPQEVLDGETLEVSGADLTVQAWEGRTYDSDVLFYVNNGTLTMEGVNLLARDEENEEESAQTLVQVFDGSVVMGASVAVNGGFTLDFRSAESEKLWDEDSALTDEKVGSPVIELTEDFQPDSNGYSITVLGQSEEGQRQEVVRTSGMTDAQVQSYAGSFALMGEDSQALSLEVDQQDQNQSATTVDSGAAPASLSLYAVRDANSIIYWNPGDKFNYNNVEYPAGSDENRDGLTPNAALKTFAKALEAAKTNNTSNIVCMQTINLNDGTVSGDQYLEYDSATKTFKLHGVLVQNQTIRLTNWLQNLPIVDIRGGYTLSLENVELTSHGTTGSERGSNLVTVGHGATVTMGTKATVTGGSYIQVEFAEGVPNPIQVSSQDAKATIFASGITYASHYEGTKLVQASESLVSGSFGGDKSAAGEHLLGKFGLSTLNTSPSPSGQDRPVKWSLVQNTTPEEANSLVLEAAKTYETIYIDPIRGSDDYDGLTCLYPVKTMERALEVLQEGINTVLPLRAQADAAQKTDEWIEQEYPLPGRLAACSTIEITDAKNWDWSTYQETDPVTHTVVKPYLTAHEEGSQGAEGQPTHQAPSYVIRVDGSSANLTLKDVRIVRTLDTFDIWTDRETWNFINVVNGGQLTLDGSTELYTQSELITTKTPAYMGVGIVAGWNQPASFVTSDMIFNGSSAATVTMAQGWTGSIHGMSRGVVLVGNTASMTMYAGTITDNQSDVLGAGVSAYHGAQFTMEGGTISNNQAPAGAGVFVVSKYGALDQEGKSSSKFTMSAGTIQGNSIDLDIDSYRGFDGMGGAGILSYYGVVELGKAGGQKDACIIQNNRLSRGTVANKKWTTSNGIGVSIYQQNTWDDYALVVNGATITNNTVNDDIEYTQQSEMDINGIGMSLSEVKSAQIENAEFSNNRLESYFRVSGNKYVRGGGLYVATTQAGANFTFRNLSVTNNKINSGGMSQSSYGYAAAQGGGIYLGEMPDDAITLLEHSDISYNELGLPGESWTSSVSAAGGGVYSSVWLRINDVTITNNQAGNKDSGSGYGGGIYGSVLWANAMTLDSNSACDRGGGWNNTMKRPGDFDFVKVESVIQDCVITNNRTLVNGVNAGDGDGGGIAFHGYGHNYTCTLTETSPGKMQITKNHAAGTGGGVSMNLAGTTVFDFTTPWENTAENGAGNLLSNTVSTSEAYDAVTYLLKGAFVGTDSVQVLGASGQKDLYVDLNQVTFQGDKPGDTVVTLTDPGTVVSLLTSGDASHPLGIKIDPDKFGAGSVVVRPANLDKVTMPILSVSADQPGGYTFDSAERSYEALKDASTNGSGTPTTNYITVTGLPLRTQLTAVPEGELTSLGLVAEGVYLDGVNGKDGNDGLSSQTAVRTWGEAVELLKKYSTTPPTEEQQTTGFQPIIWVCNTVSLSSGETLSLPQSVVSQTYKDYETERQHTPERAVFRRFGSFQDAPMFQVTSGTVTVTNARIDGNSGAMASPNYYCSNIAVAMHATLNVENGARIYNGYASCVELEDMATLNVTQTFKPGEVNADTDEGYGIQIDTNSQKVRTGWLGVVVKNSSKVNLNQHAYLGSEVVKFGASAGYALGFRGAGTINMNGNALVRSSYGVKYAGRGTLIMNDSATLEAAYEILGYESGSASSTLTMNGSSRIAAGYDRNTTTLRVSPSSKFTMTMLDQSSVECAIISDVNNNAATDDGVFKLIMGRKGGTDTPSITVPTNSSKEQPGTIQMGGGHMYLEMNAGSSVKGSIHVWGMTPASETAPQPRPNYGIMMRDQAKLEAADNNPAAVALLTGRRTYNSQLTDFDVWDGTQQFSIVLEGEAQMLGGIHGKFSSDTELADQIMGDDQHITLRGNAKVTGTIGDKDYGTSISKVVLEESSTIQASEGMTPQDYVVKARQVILKGTSTISASTTDADTAVFGQGVSVYALKGMSLDGTANVKGPILLAQDVSITLTSPVPDTAQEGCFKLHLAAYHMGRVVVQSGGDPVTDASTYLSYFVKHAAQDEASQVNLVGDGNGNIILNRLWNVYLSSNGDDKNDGASPQTAVRTFKRAKELLTTVEGYGPTDENGNGSNIIIPDSVTIAIDDYDWSFDEGGTLRNVKGETWTPVITRSPTVVYTKPLIMINYESYYYGTADIVKFSNITLDAGGDQATFSLEERTEWPKNQNTLLYFDGNGNQDTPIRVLELGEGTVIQNLDYDMAKNGTGLTQLALDEYAGGYAVNVTSGELLINGAVIQDFHVKNFNYDGGLSGTSADNSATIVHVTGQKSSLVFNSGSIRNNSVNVAKFRTDSDRGGVGIVSVSGGATFTMTGGEIANNTVSGNADQIETAQNGYAVPVGILVLDSTYYETSAKMSGGSIRDNVNQMQATDESSEDRYAEGIISVGSRRQARNNTDPSMEFTIAGGSITGNQARRGSAITLAYGTVVLAGGTIQDNRSVVEVGAEGWQAEYSPIFIGDRVPDDSLNNGLQQLVLQGDGCKFDSPICLPSGRQITVSGQLRDTSRVYEIYQGDSNLVQGSAVVVPDNNNVKDVTPYQQNFRVYAKGMVLDRGRVDQDISIQQGTRNELDCLVLMKAVFLDGSGGMDPKSINIFNPQYDRGLRPDEPVKTLDAARAIGQAFCEMDEGVYEDTADHQKHKDHYVIYAVGPVYEKLYEGTVLNGNLVGFTKNEDSKNFQFTLGGASYLTRYTGWEMYVGNGQSVSGKHYYGNLVEVNGAATFQNITVQGRREIDSVDKNGETMVVVNPGAKLTMGAGTKLELNNATGSRPKPNDPGLTQSIDSRGGAIRVAAGANLVMTGGIIDSSCTALDGGSIYLEGGADTQQTAKLTISNQVNIGGEIYLGGAQGKDIPISVDQSFAPVSPIRIGMESDYDGKPVVRWTDGTPVNEAMLEQFSYSSSVSALYETEAVSSSGDGGTLDTIALDLRRIVYLNPAGGDDAKSGATPVDAVETLDRIYSMFENPEEDIPGVLVFVMNPITVAGGKQLVISNGQLKEDGVTKHISVFSQGEASTTFDSNIGIVHTETEKVINCELYFRRYAKTSDQGPPAGYNKDSNVKELFVVEGGGQLQLNGVYLDGQSLGIQTTGQPGLSSDGVVAQAPLVQVKAGGSAQFLSGALGSYQGSTASYQAVTSQLSNNTNNNSKTTPLPGTDGITEGSSAGIEILSSGTENGWATETRGKVVLQNSKFENLKLVTDDSGKAVIGGSDIYQNGELSISNNIRFGGTVFLEGNGKSGEDETAIQSRQTSRWISVSAYGKPVESAFQVVVRDAYHNRRMVVYPYSESDKIQQSEIAMYMLTQEASRHYILVNEQLSKGQGENDFLGKGENTLWLRVPPVVYIDPVSGNDETGDGRYPETAVKTLPKAIDVMKGLSAKVLYVLNPIPITGNSYLYPTGYTYDGTSVALPSQNLQLDIRRYVQPDAPTTAEHYKTASYTSGALFDIQSGGSLTLEGNVILDGASQGQTGPEVPADQAYANGIQVAAPLVTVDQGGTLELRSDGEGEEVTRPTLTNNHNTGVPGEGAQREEGGAVYNAGNVILNGGMLVNNTAQPVTGTDGMQGMADGIYQAGDLTIRSYPQGLKGQTVYLAANHVISVDMQIQEMGDAAGEISLDMDNAVAGRDVVTYTNATNVDAESARYSLGNSVPGSLFLVQAADDANTLELQDWQQLKVTVPEEVFLVVYEAGANGAQVGKGDVDSYGYGLPEYTITNGGTRDVRVSVNGFEKIATQTGKGDITLVANKAELSGEEALLYLALTKSSETAEAGNSFANLAETSLKLSTGGNIQLGTLTTGAHGSFAFTGSANQAFLNQWMDSAFPANPPEGGSLAEARKEYMRTKNSDTGETSLKNAAAQFKLTYRIELA